MKKSQPHFRYNKRQRNGVFYFLIVILSLQIAYFMYGKFSTSSNQHKEQDYSCLQKRLDSLKNKNKIDVHAYRFNPNYMTDEQGYAVGLSLIELDRIFKHRREGLWMRDMVEFQKVTFVSDSMLAVLDAHFVFPSFKKPKKKTKTNPVLPVRKDLNLADSVDLKKINGIGTVLAARIVKYRNKLKGFSFEGQLKEVYGLKEEVIKKLLKIYEIKSLPKIKKININTASFKEVLSIVYIDYETTKLIFNYRKEVHRIENLLELKKIAGFPIDKYDRIALYLQAE